MAARLMGQDKITFESGSLWARIVERTEQAIRHGTLHLVPTRYEYVKEDNVDFLVRIVSNLTRKDEAVKAAQHKPQASDKTINPFLPYERDLFVADVSPTHVCILNKFNVVKYHLLIITRVFEHQESWLTVDDFEAVWKCMAEFEGLTFYNAGEAAGASQSHKHLQMVPLPLARRGPRIPIEPLLQLSGSYGEPEIIPLLPFLHAFACIDPSWHRSVHEIAVETFDTYTSMLSAVNLVSEGAVDENGVSHPYNLLITKEWMLLIPRANEFVDSISVNALGFAGAMLVRNEREMHLLKELGPMTILKQTAKTY
jgi:ATP adenylyltransferase